MNAPCEIWTERLSWLAADCLPEDEAVLVRRHAAECAGCSARLRELESLRTSLVAARPDAARPAAAILARLDEALAAERAGPLPIHKDTPIAPAAWIALATAAAAAGIFLCFSLSMGRGGREAPIGQPIVRQQKPGARPVEEPVLASRGRPTLLDYQRAASESEERFEALLREDSSLVSLGGASFGGSAPRVIPYRISPESSP